MEAKCERNELKTELSFDVESPFCLGDAGLLGCSFHHVLFDIQGLSSFLRELQNELEDSSELLAVAPPGQKLP